MTRGRSESRKRSVRGESNPGIILRQPRKYFLKGTCTRGGSASREKNLRGAESILEGRSTAVQRLLKMYLQDRFVILSNVNSIKQNRAVKQGTSVCSRVTRLTNNKKTQKSYFSTTCTTIELCRKTQNHWNLRETQSLGKTRCKKFWDQFDEYDSHSLRHVKQVSGKIRDHRFGKIQVTIPRQRSPHAMKFEDRSQEESERQQRCARGKAWSIAKHTYKLKEKTRLHSTFPRRNVYSWLHQQKSRKKESLW